jgi:hypothetical protein
METKIVVTPPQDEDETNKHQTKPFGKQASSPSLLVVPSTAARASFDTKNSLASIKSEDRTPAVIPSYYELERKAKSLDIARDERWKEQPKKKRFVGLIHCFSDKRPQLWII